jgi:hypothetical protein
MMICRKHVVPQMKEGQAKDAATWGHIFRRASQYFIIFRNLDRRNIGRKCLFSRMRVGIAPRIAGRRNQIHVHTKKKFG